MKKKEVVILCQSLEIYQMSYENKNLIVPNACLEEKKKH